MCLSLCLCLSVSCVFAEGTIGKEAQAPTMQTLLLSLAQAYLQPSEEAVTRIDALVEQLENPMARPVAEYWKKIWLDPAYRLLLHGQDDPAQLPVTGRHAFVVLGYELKDGEMTEELIGRCEAAAAAARAFPESILVCSGGATGENNPDGHTEAGLMKAWLMESGGIAEDRILVDESAMTTEENALNTIEILREQGVETMTIITSSYHQRRGQTLYYTVAEQVRQEQGYTVEIVGNYSFPVNILPFELQMEAMKAVFQIGMILGQEMDLSLLSQMGK